MPHREEVILVIDECGVGKTLYTESIPLEKLGKLKITRASHVEPDGKGWKADMRPSGGPVLKSFKTRSAALAAEVKWLKKNKLK